MTTKKQIEQEINRIDNAIQKYEEKHSFSLTNNITYKDTCVYCRKVYLKQLTCDHKFETGRYNEEHCRKCGYDDGKDPDVCFSYSNHLMIEKAQITDECIVCGMNEKQHTEFPCKKFPTIKK